MTTNPIETNFTAFFEKLRGAPGFLPFCDLAAGLANAVRREIGANEEAAFKKLAYIGTGITFVELQRLCAALPTLFTCADRCAAAVKDGLVSREAMHELVHVRAALAEAGEEGAAASAMLADFLTALNELQVYEGGVPRLTTREVVLRGYGDFLLGKAEEPSLQSEDPWLAVAEKYLRLSEAPGERPRRYARDFVATLSMADRREIADAIFIVTEMERCLQENPRHYERALKAAGCTDRKSEIEDASNRLIDLYYAMIEHLLLNVTFPKRALSRREEQQAAMALGDRLVAAAEAVTDEAKENAKDAFRASGLMVELLRTVKPGEFQKLVLQLPMKRRAQVTNALQTMAHASCRLTEDAAAASA